MATKLNPYISFNGNAHEAIEFYKSVFGGKLAMNTFAESHMAEAGGDKIMHAMLEADNGLVLMASDTPQGMPYNPGSNVSISLSGEDKEELRGYWEKLSEGSTITMPLDKAPWGDIFGMLTDKFGISWLVNINQTNS